MVTDDGDQEPLRPEPVDAADERAPHQAPTLAKDFGSARIDADKTRRAGAIWLGSIGVTVAVLTALFILVKMGSMLSANHGLTQAFLAAEGEEFRREILLYLGIVVVGQSVVAIWLIAWAGRMIQVATRLAIPVRDLPDDTSRGQVKKALKLVQPMMKFRSGDKGG